MKKWIQVHDSAPVWVNFTSDDKFAYITGARNSIVHAAGPRNSRKSLPNNARALTARTETTSAGTTAFIYTIGKGEESHNRGKMVGMVDADTMDVEFQARVR